MAFYSKECHCPFDRYKFYLKYLDLSEREGEGEVERERERERENFKISGFD